MIGANGRQRWVALTSAPVRDTVGRPLHRSIQYQDVTDRKCLEGQLHHLADHDPLTGLFDPRRFEQELVREIASGRRCGSSGAVLMLDLDTCKYVNDSLGHSAGDERPRSELLIRMLDRDGDLVPPGTFLFIAERFGLTGEIDRPVVHEAIELLGDEERTGSQCVFELNLSPKSLSTPGLLELISRRLHETGAGFASFLTRRATLA